MNDSIVCNFGRRNSLAGCQPLVVGTGKPPCFMGLNTANRPSRGWKRTSWGYYGSFSRSRTPNMSLMALFPAGVSSIGTIIAATLLCVMAYSIFWGPSMNFRYSSASILSLSQSSISTKLSNNGTSSIPRVSMVSELRSSRMLTLSRLTNSLILYS